MVNSAVEAAKFGDDLTKGEIDKTCQELVTKHKMREVKPDRAAFVKAARPAIDELAKAWAPGVLDAVSKHLEVTLHAAACGLKRAALLPRGAL